MIVLFCILGLIALILILRQIWKGKKYQEPVEAFPEKWSLLLLEHVNFYGALNKEERELFEYKVHGFILNHKITGINTTVDELDKLLVASSAVIPIFRFPQWRYPNLYEVLLYPDTFDERLRTQSRERRIFGMVGTGRYKGVMILSKRALHTGFSNKTDKKNTAIHEFVHLIDMLDGGADGVPKVLMDKQFVIPWMSLMMEGIDKIHNKKSDINPYGATAKAEFFAVASEYFFERPKLLEKKHPKLYAALEELFDHDMSERSLKKH